MLGFLRSVGARYVIVDEEKLDDHRGLREARGAELRLLHRSRAGGRRAVVYQVLSAEPG